jgi:hypothetical protein
MRRCREKNRKDYHAATSVANRDRPLYMLG